MLDKSLFGHTVLSFIIKIKGFTDVFASVKPRTFYIDKSDFGRAVVIE